MKKKPIQFQTEETENITHKVKLLDFYSINSIFAVIACIKYAMELNGYEVIKGEEDGRSIHINSVTIDKENLEEAFASLKKLSSSLNITEIKSQKGKLISVFPAIGG